MHVVWAYFCFYDLYPFPFAQLPQYFPYRLSLLSKEYLPSILRRKHYVVFVEWYHKRTVAKLTKK